MHCKSLWIKASAKCINVNVNVDIEFSMPKTKGTIQTSVSSHRMGDVHVCEGTVEAEAYIWTVE